MLCAETHENDIAETFDWDRCTEEFFQYLDSLAIDEDGDERKVLIVFHNFKGYDAMFVIRYLYY